MSVTQKILPFFPLGILLLPGEDFPLRIFEPRYIQLMEESKADGFTFAIPFVLNDKIQEYGCEVKLQQVVAERPNGRMVVTVEGVSLVKINSFREQLDEKLYAGGTVEIMTEADQITNPVLIDLIIHYTERFDKDFLHFIDKTIGFNDVLCALNLSSEDKYRFITMKDSRTKEQFLIRQMQYLMLIRKQEQLLGNEFGMN